MTDGAPRSFLVVTDSTADITAEPAQAAGI